MTDFIFLALPSWSDVFNSDQFHISIRLFLATILGGFVGLEREHNNHPAGFRTHILVCVGSALIMLISLYGFTEWNEHPNARFDPARLSAQVISGIGFLGAGTILRNGFNVSGLTTAASLWVVAGIGLAIGAGFYYGAILSTVLVLFSLILLNRLERTFIRHRRYHTLDILVLDKPGKLGEISLILGKKDINVQKVIIEDENRDGDYIKIRFHLSPPKGGNFTAVLDQVRHVEGVKEVEIVNG